LPDENFFRAAPSLWAVKNANRSSSTLRAARQIYEGKVFDMQISITGVVIDYNVMDTDCTITFVL
jgi:hypothetical protein